MSTQIEDTNPINESLYQLQRITLRLQRLGVIAFLLTVFTLASTVFVVAMPFLGWIRDPLEIHFRALPAFLVQVQGSIMCGVLVALAFFERMVRRGNVLFEEISDELEWKVRHEEVEHSTTPPDQRPTLNPRIVLRAFAQTTDLPLVPGKFGPLFYVIGNLVFVFFSVHYTYSVWRW